MPISPVRRAQVDTAVALFARNPMRKPRNATKTRFKHLYTRFCCDVGAAKDLFFICTLNLKRCNQRHLSQGEPVTTAGITIQPIKVSSSLASTATHQKLWQTRKRRLPLCLHYCTRHYCTRRPSTNPDKAKLKGVASSFDTVMAQTCLH